MTGAGSSRGRAPSSLMSSHSSIATNVSDDADVKFTPPTSEPTSVADQVVGGLIIPDEMRDFINRTYGSQTAGAPVTPGAPVVPGAPVSLTADSTVADSPAAPVESTSGIDEPAGNPAAETKPSALTSCMYEAQSGRNSAQPLGNSAQPLGNFARPQQLPGAVGVAAGSDGPSRSFDVPAARSSTTYFISPSVPRPYQINHEVQVSQVSQSWRPDSSTGVRTYSPAAYRGSSGGTLDLSADDAAVRHRRNPHQMNWWTRSHMYGYHGSYRPNYSLPVTSLHPPRTAASYVPSQMSPTCNQVHSSIYFTLHCVP